MFKIWLIFSAEKPCFNVTKYGLDNIWGDFLGGHWVMSSQKKHLVTLLVTQNDSCQKLSPSFKNHLRKQNRGTP
jgi:hypothetical protein